MTAPVGLSSAEATPSTLTAPSKSGAVPTYSRAEAAKLLRVSVDWMREHHSELLPHLRMGRLIRFTDAHLAEIQRAREVRPAPRPVTDGIRRRRRMPVDWRTLQ